MQKPPSPGLRETAALVLLPLLWPIGVFFLWSSRLWNNRDKLLAPLFPIGGYGALSLYYYLAPAQCPMTSVNDRAVSSTCASSGSVWSGPIGTVVVALLLIMPIATSLYLYLRLRQRWRMVHA